MSCYAHREDPARFVDIFNRTVAPVVGPLPALHAPLLRQLQGPRRGARGATRRCSPRSSRRAVDEIHVEMASREFAELEVIGAIAAVKDVAVGIVDVKSYWIEPVEEIADRVRRCLRHAPAERLSFAPDCGLSQTARWAARAKLANLVEGVARVRAELGLA